MLTELQTIFLTCLLGPEDPTAFARFQKREEGARYRAANREKCRAASRKSSQEKRDSDPEAARERVRSYRLEHPEQAKKSSREGSAKRRLEDPEKARKASRESNQKRRREHLEEVRAIARFNARRDRLRYPERRKEADRRARTGENRGAPLAARRKNNSRRYKNDPAYKIECCLRSRLLIALKVDGASKSAHTLDLLGCSVGQFKAHLESFFKPGMSWENYGPVWHIDHIKPCAKFDLTDPEQQKICFHWTNLQPLFAEENLKKGGK